eukprot:3935581-Rhodomonas_salina.3
MSNGVLVPSYAFSTHFQRTAGVATHCPVLFWYTFSGLKEAVSGAGGHGCGDPCPTDQDESAGNRTAQPADHVRFSGCATLLALRDPGTSIGVTSLHVVLTCVVAGPRVR